MNKKMGYITITNSSGIKEIDTMMCIHCGCHWKLKSTDGLFNPGGFCRICMHAICPKCVGRACLPFEKKLYLYECRQDLFKKMGLTL